MENNNQLEQVANAPEAVATQNDVASVEEKASDTSFGKFKTKEQLLEAYNSLESEFTRRSQKIKELEESLKDYNQEKKWQSRVNELNNKYPIATNFENEISEHLRQNGELLKDENCLEKALLAVLAKAHGTNNSNKSEAFKRQTQKVELSGAEILKSIQENVPETPLGGGEIPVSLPLRPKTLAEASKLARKAFKNG